MVVFPRSTVGNNTMNTVVEAKKQQSQYKPLQAVCKCKAFQTDRMKMRVVKE